MIEAGLTSITGITGSIGIEVSPRDGQAQALHLLKSRLSERFEFERVVVIACQNACRSQIMV